jgi:acetyl esterase/lipase
MKKTLCSAGMLFFLGLISVSRAQDADSPPGANAGSEESEPKVPPGVTAKIDVPYVPGGGTSRLLDLYLPSSGQTVPLVIFIHPGGWHVLDKGKAAEHAFFLLKHGYAVASINYRLSQEAVFPAQIEDCRSAIRFLRSQAATYHIQPDHIGVWGSSAGGQLAALLGTSAAADFSTNPAKVTDLGTVDESVRVQCVVDWYGPSDFTQVMGHNAKHVDNAAVKMLGPHTDEADLMSKAKWASPITYVRSDNPPFFIEHGDADPTVPVEQSRELAAALKKAGVEARLTEMPGSKHGGKAFGTPENQLAVLNFFESHLKKSN